MSNIDTVDKSIQELEEALSITLEIKNSGEEQENCYSGYKNTPIRKLKLSNLYFSNFEALKPIAHSLNSLTLVNCIVEDLQSLVELDCITSLTLDGVRLDSPFDPNQQTIPTLKGHFQTVILKNMILEHPTSLLPLAHSLEYLKCYDCQIHNLYELNLLPSLYYLELDHTQVQQSAEDVLYKQYSDSQFILLHLANMRFNNFDFLVPITKNIKRLDLEDCQIHSLDGLNNFCSIETLRIDTATTVEVMDATLDYPATSFQIDKCVIKECEMDEDEYDELRTPFNLKTLVSIAPFIKSFSFRQYKLSNKGYFEYFTALDTLHFEKCIVNFEHFLPLAHQLKAINIDACILRKTKQLTHFVQLESIEIHEGYGNGNTRPLKNLKKLLPLKNQLKKLNLSEYGVKGIKYLSEFDKLESLKVYEISAKKAAQIFNLPNLKRLSLDVESKSKETCTFDLSKLKGLEALQVISNSKIVLKGLAELKELKIIKLDTQFCKIKDLDQLENLNYFACNSDININELGKMKSLQTLELDIEDDYKIKGLKQFPNLKRLQIRGSGHKNIHLGKLEHLKVLDLGRVESNEKIKFLTELPKLEKLDLESKRLKSLPDLSQLKNLKVLSLAENYKLKNIEGLKGLKKLEKLNLYSNNISDIRVLNNLPKLKEVNIARNSITLKEAEVQLDKPEILVYLGLPYVPFVIWKTTFFEL